MMLYVNYIFFIVFYLPVAVLYEMPRIFPLFSAIPNIIINITTIP